MATAQTSRVLTLVFTDLADSTALKAQRGDAIVGELIARHRGHVARLARDTGGRVIDWAGDGCFLTFETSSAAVLFGLKLQETHHWESALPRVRIGIHLGEVSETPIDGSIRVEGLLVDLTARISGLACPGQILVSGAVQQSARQRLGPDAMDKPIRWESHGPYCLKGFDEPVDVREAGIDGVSPFVAPKRSEKAWPAGSPARGVGTGEIRKIAVLPFTSFSKAPEQDWFVDGMTETLIAELARIKALTVISRTSVMHYKNTSKSLREIATELRADALVEGSVMRAGNRVRITAQLIDAESDGHLWAGRYDGTMEEILDVQVNVALAIAGEVNVALSPEDTAPLKKSRPVNPEAFEALMKARHCLHVDSVEGFTRAVEFAEQALAIDPEYADAYATLATIYSQHIIFGTVDHERAYTRARVAAVESIRLGGESALALAALAQIIRTTDWDWDKALEYGLRAAELDPSDANIQSLCGFGMAYKGDLQSAEARMRRAIETDPMNPQGYMGLGTVLVAQARLDEAIELTTTHERKFPQYLALGLISLIAYVRKGQLEKAVAEGQRLVEKSGGREQYLTIAGFCYALAGDRAAAESMLGQLREQVRERSVSPSSLALLAHALGYTDEAYSLFLDGYRKRDFALIWLKRVGFFELPPLKDDARVQRLVARVGIV